MISLSNNRSIEVLLIRNIISRNTQLELENELLRKAVDDKDHLLETAYQLMLDG